MLKGRVVHAKYRPDSQRFKPARVVSVDHVRATCTLHFYGHDDDTDSIPLTRDRIRPSVSAKRENGKLERLIWGEVRAAAVRCKGGSLIISPCVRLQAIIIRDEIGDITCGVLEHFPDAHRLGKARTDICNVIHAATSFQHKTLKGGGVKEHTNPFNRMDAEQRTKSMLAEVTSINAYLDEHYPRPSGERSRSDEWQEIAFPA